MGENTKIEWAHHTFNPWIGCAKVSPGCANCYAEALMDSRMGRAKWGPDGTRVRTSESYWRQPLKWDRDAAKAGERRRVFPSLLDPFEDRPELEEWRDDLFNLIAATPNLDWLLLTKRPENITRMMIESFRRVDYCSHSHKMLEKAILGNAPGNLWLGTSVENQEQADIRIPHLAACNASVRFLSMEPLLGPVSVPLEGIDWVIVGGESGKNARPMHPSWVRSIRDQCVEAGVPFFMKQWGEYEPYEEHGTQPFWEDTRGRLHDQHAMDIVKDDGSPSDEWRHDFSDIGVLHRRVGKKAAGRVLDGRTWDEYPNREPLTGCGRKGRR